jgi:hypothetical protein
MSALACYRKSTGSVRAANNPGVAGERSASISVHPEWFFSAMDFATFIGTSIIIFRQPRYFMEEYP